MIIFDLVNNHTGNAREIMAKRRNVKDSFGKRVRDEREEKELTQADVVRILREQYGIEMSEAAFSKIEIGETKRMHIDLQMALASLLGADIRYLLTGEEPESIGAWSEEAEKLAAMVDGLSPRARRLLLDGAQMLKQIESEILESQREIARLLEENINLLSNSDRRIAGEYIARILRHRNGR